MPLVAGCVILFKFVHCILLFTLDTVGLTFMDVSLKSIEHDLTFRAVTSPRYIFTKFSVHLVPTFDPLNVASKLSIYIIAIYN